MLFIVSCIPRSLLDGWAKRDNFYGPSFFPLLGRVGLQSVCQIQSIFGYHPASAIFLVFLVFLFYLLFNYHYLYQPVVLPSINASKHWWFIFPYIVNSGHFPTQISSDLKVYLRICSTRLRLKQCWLVKLTG